MSTYRLAIRRDTASNWTSVDPVLGQGEPSLDITNNKIKVGDGVSVWSALPYLISYSDAEVDALLNTSTASSGDFLSWDGSDYVWTVPGAGGVGNFTDLTATSSFTSPGIDDNATTTQLTIEDASTVFNNDTKVSRAHRYGTAFAIENTSTGGKAWELRSTGVDNLLGTGDLQFNVDGSNSLTLKADQSAELSGDLTVTGNFESTGIDDNATSTAITIDANENVGINATNPLEKLHVGGNALIGGEVESIASGTTAGFKWGQNTATHYWKWAEFNNGTASLQNNSTASGASVIAVDTSNNVGIGTSAPSVDFEVNGIAKINDYLSLNDNGYIRGEYAGELRFQGGSTATTFYDSTNITERMRIDASGNVGIGTDSPNAGGDYNNGWGLSLGLNRTFIGTSAGGDSVLGGASGSTHTALYSNGAEAMRISASGNVGIGTSNPVTYQSQGPVLNIGDTSDSYAQLNFTTATNGIQYIGFGDATSGTGRYQGLISFDHSTNRMGFGTIGSTTPNLSIDSAGNVGIGTSQPGSYNTNANDLVVGLSGTGGSRGLTIASGSTSFGTLAFANGPTGNDLARQFIRADHSSGAMLFATAAGERMRIAADGSVGIGDLDPSPITSNAPSLTLRGQVSSKTGGLKLESSDRSVDGYLYGDTGNGITLANRLAGPLKFATSNTYRMTIDSSGNVLVGLTGSATGTQNGVEIVNSGIIRTDRNSTGTISHVEFYNPNGLVGQITTNGSTTTYATSSDERLKENVVDAPAGNIDDLKVRSFDWKADGEHQDYGFIAQELETVAPYAVSKGETDEDMWGVDYSKLVPMLVKEIQDLKAKVEALENN
jgi:hypothetical protein